MHFFLWFKYLHVFIDLPTLFAIITYYINTKNGRVKSSQEQKEMPCSQPLLICEFLCIVNMKHTFMNWNTIKKKGGGGEEASSAPIVAGVKDLMVCM